MELGFGVLEAWPGGRGFTTKPWNGIKLALARQSQVSGTSYKYYVFVGRRCSLKELGSSQK
jgi:hypothetical protein